MPADQIEKLEGLVAEIVKEIKRVSSENDRLVQEVKKLEAVKGQVREAEKKNRDQLQVFSRMEKAQQKMEKDKSTIRVKVQKVLEELGNTDFL
ncbi:MAG: hypothetical protein V3U37_03815 [Nitrospinaceae bacterium]